jgi:uncharacterized protein involved in type VI secretion and phage assembly
MNLYDALIETGAEQTSHGRVAGVVVGIVTNNQDEEGMGRVKVKFPWLSDADESYWARIVSPASGGGHGLFFLPEVDTEVLVVFAQGDVRFPYILGSLWNGKDAPPLSNDDGENNVRLIRSRSGHEIRLTDKEGGEKVEIIDKSGKNSIVFNTAENSISITSDKDITLAAAQGTIKLDAQKVEIKSSADARVEAGAGLDIKAGATMNIKGAMVNIN